MRTKTLLAAAALAAGLATSSAQIFSQNIVGYANSPFPPGNTFCVSPFTGATNAEESLSCLQAGDSVFVFNGSSYTGFTFFGAGTWSTNGIDLTPAPVLTAGQGFIYGNGSGGNETNTYVGTVLLSNSIVLHPGNTLIGSFTPIASDAESTNYNFPLAVGDTITTFSGSAFTGFTFFGPGTWSTNGIDLTPAPVLAIAQGFFYVNGSGGNETWTQNVVVGP